MIIGHYRRPRTRRALRCVLIAASVFAGVLSGAVAATPAGATTTQHLSQKISAHTMYRAIGKTTGRNIAPYGQCTWGAFEIFHRATGLWPRITGDAWLWGYTAAANGWTVVYRPQPRSIVVFQPTVQGASPRFGHVGWVESVQQGIDGRWITVLEMNGTAGPGHWDRRTIRDVGGMSYILAP